MKQYELKDLETGKEYIVAFRKGKQWIPCLVKVVKEYTVKFVRPKMQVNSPLEFNTNSPLEFNKEYTISDFFHECRGVDLFGNKFRMIWTFETFGIANAWIEFENNIDEYIENNGIF